jgi:hypothetical protein
MMNDNESTDEKKDIIAFLWARYKDDHTALQLSAGAAQACTTRK